MPKKKQIIKKSYPVDVKVKDEDKGIIEAYVSMFGNIDSMNEIVEDGAFKDSLKSKLPKGVWAHNWDKPIAKTLEAKEDEKGLYIKGQFNLETQRGREAFSDLKFGTIDEFSIGYSVLEDAQEIRDGVEVRLLKKLKLFEWSPVLAGANPTTELIGVKKDQEKEDKDDKDDKDDKEAEKVMLMTLLNSINDLQKSLKRLNKVLPSFEKLLPHLEADKGKKVEPISDNSEKIVRIRQCAKQVDKNIESIIRITKN